MLILIFSMPSFLSQVWLVSEGEMFYRPDHAHFPPLPGTLELFLLQLSRLGMLSNQIFFSTTLFQVSIR